MLLTFKILHYFKNIDTEFVILECKLPIFFSQYFIGQQLLIQKAQHTKSKKLQLLIIFFNNKPQKYDVQTKKIQLIQAGSNFLKDKFTL